jgi:hypothetical protein
MGHSPFHTKTGHGKAIARILPHRLYHILSRTGGKNICFQAVNPLRYLFMDGIMRWNSGSQPTAQLGKRWLQINMRASFTGKRCVGYLDSQ